MEGGPGAAPRAAPGGGEALAALDMMKGAAEVSARSTPAAVECTPRRTAAGVAEAASD